MTHPTGGRAVLTPGPQGLAHLELLLAGACPLPGFMTRREADRLDRPGPPPAGAPWPVPVVLAAPDAPADAREVVLTDPEGAPLAELTVTEAHRDGTVRLAGPVRPAAAPVYGSLRSLRLPVERVRSARDERRPLLAVVTDRPLHHRALAQVRAALAGLGEADLLVLVDVPLDAEGAAPAVLAARELLPRGTRFAAVTLPTAAADGAPAWPAERRGLLAAHVAAAYGATHVLLELEGAGGAGALADAPVKALSFGEWVYDTARRRWCPADEVAPGNARAEWGADAVAEALARGGPLPAWLTPEPVAAELARMRPARTDRGLVLFFTGLSGSGKSTVARGVAEQVRRAGRTVTLLDGDVVRRLLSSGLTFSRADRDLNIRRIGYVAAEVARHGGVAVCAPIAPYAATRAEVRRMAEETGDFFLVYVATPIEVCEARDRKGLYAKARAGQIPEFTGVSDPYEAPGDADLVIDTSAESEAESVARVVAALRDGGWLPR